MKQVYMKITITHNGLFYLANLCKIAWKQILGVTCLG